MTQPPENRDIIYPQILPVPERIQSLRGREKVRSLSRLARAAAVLSAEKCGIELDHFPKNDSGAPLPVKGWHWSLTHKTRYVAAVVSRSPVGIDLEELKPVSSGLYKRVASDHEWGLSGDDPAHLFFRFWTAKESVTKSSGIGFADFSKCLIVEVPDTTSIVVDYRGTRHLIQHHFFDTHIATVLANDRRVVWQVHPEPPESLP